MNNCITIEMLNKLEDARKAYIELTNNVAFDDNGEACYIANQSVMSAFDDLFDVLKPITDIEIPYPEPCKLCIECDGSCY